MTIRPNDGPPPDRPFGDLPNDGPIPFKKKGSGGATDAPTGNLTPTEEMYLRWRAVPIGDLADEETATEWYWHGYLGSGAMTLFLGLWKSGKTTLLSVLLKSLDGAAETFCGLSVRRCRVLLITEEARRHWIERRDMVGIGNHVSVIIKPFTKSDKANWQLFIDNVAAQVRDEGFDLVIFDSIFNLWAVSNENEAPEVRDALMPLNALTDAGVGILLVAHPKKGDAGEAQAARGSGALPAFVDIIMEMRRFDANQREDTRRVITSYSRFEETPEELVIEYDRDRHEYSSAGTRADAKQADRIKTLLEVLPDEEIAYSMEEIFQHWPTDGTVGRPSRSNLQRDIKACMDSNLVRSRGKGTKGEPLRYFRFVLGRI